MFKSQVTKQVKTHLQWTKTDKFRQGKESEVHTVLKKVEWKTITFIGCDFKFNLKQETQEDYADAVRRMEEILQSQKYKLILRDTSNPENDEYSCEVVASEQGKKLTKPRWVKNKDCNWDFTSL